MVDVEQDIYGWASCSSLCTQQILNGLVVLLTCIVLCSWLAILVLLIRRNVQHTSVDNDTQSTPISTQNHLRPYDLVHTACASSTRTRNFSASRQATNARHRLIDIEFGSYIKLSAQVLLYLVQSLPITAMTLMFG
jgi:hypothetical protein